jgi:hypothetical protein
VRTRAESVRHVNNSDKEAAALSRSNIAHVFLIVVFVVGGLAIGDAGSEVSTLFMIAPGFAPLAFLLGGLAEVVVPSSSSPDVSTIKIARASKVIGAWLAGLLVLSAVAAASI